MNVMMVRAKIKGENVAEAQAATVMVLQALEQAQLDVRYAASTLSDGVTLVAFLQLEPRSGASAARLPRTWSSSSTSRAGTPSRRNVEHIAVIGSYQLF